MSTMSWIGNAPFVQQEGTITPVADNSQTYTIGIPTVASGKKVTYVSSGAATVDEIVNGLVAALKASTEGEFLEATWSAGTGSVEYVVKEAGRPITVDASATGAGTLTPAVTVTPSSPNDLNIAANYSGGALPVNGDNLRLDTGNRDIKWNLGALSGVALASFVRTSGYTGKVRLDIYNDSGKYSEYRATELTVKSSLWDIQQLSSDEKRHIAINAGTTAFTANINGSSGGSIGREKLEFRGVNASDVLNVSKASVSIAPIESVAANIGTINTIGSSISIGSAVTLTTVNNNGSTIQTASNIPTLNSLSRSARTIFVNGAGTTTTTNLDEGRLVGFGANTLTNITAGDGGVIDLEQDKVAKTISGNVTLEAGSSFLDKYNNVASYTLKTKAPLSRINIRTSTEKTLVVSNS